jgi:glucokinase
VLLTSSFRQRFFNKGVMRAFLQQVPVRLMEHGQHGVIGAAGLFLNLQDGEVAPVSARAGENAVPR